MDLGQGYTCYLAVVSEQHGVILDLRQDWLQRWRTVYANPYPCPYAVYGYSLILTKLLTTIEEHTAWRNMNADRATLKSNAPMRKLRGEDWDPEAQPFAAGTVITVSDMKGVEPFPFDDVTEQALNKEQGCVADAQRILGLNDIAIGQVSAKARTLGENELATRESFTRTDDPIGNLQEAFEELGSVIHAIEVQTLKDMDDGRQTPATVTDAVKRADTSYDGRVTWQMIDGHYRFKPRGSVESADPNQRLKMLVDGIGLLANWAKLNPQIAARMQTPEFGDALMQMFVTEFKPRDKQPFLKPVQPAPPMLPPGMPPGAPGAPPPGAGAPNPLVQAMLAHAAPQGGSPQ
jgi:hypothetical protein